MQGPWLENFSSFPVNIYMWYLPVLLTMSIDVHTLCCFSFTAHRWSFLAATRATFTQTRTSGTETISSSTSWTQNSGWNGSSLAGMCVSVKGRWLYMILKRSYNLIYISKLHFLLQNVKFKCFLFSILISGAYCTKYTAKTNISEFCDVVELWSGSCLLLTRAQIHLFLETSLQNCMNWHILQVWGTNTKIQQ